MKIPARLFPWEGIVLCSLMAISLLRPVRADWTATGKFEYTDRFYDLNGFTGTGARPVREADVQVYDTATLQVLASGATDATGSFSLAVTDELTRDVGVRVLSSNVQIASLNFSVVDDANGDAVYSYHDGAVDQAAHAPDANVDFGTMTMPASIGDVASTDWSSQVFNTYDMGLLLSDWVAHIEGVRPSSFLTVLWNPTNARTGSFYSGSTNRLSLSDDDAYDDPNIVHEMGHYIEDEYGRSRNTGGTHYIGDNDQDPRLAYSEGFATFVSAAVLDYGGRDRPDIYQDRGSFTSGTGGGFSYSFEGATAGGATNEQAGTAALYDLIDTSSTLDGSPGTDDDAVNAQEAGVWAVVERMRVLDLPATSLEDFWDLWFSLGLGHATEVAEVFASHSMDFAPDAQEPNDVPGAATGLTVGGAYQRNCFYRTGSQAGGDEDWFQFAATAGNYYAIEVNGANGALFGRPDPEMWLIDPAGCSIVAYNNDPYDSVLNTAASSAAQDMAETVPSILWRAPVSGTYWIYLRHSSQEQNLAGRYGTYQLRVRSLAAPTPAITSVSEQRMLPGQTYQALVVGTNFARDAMVASSSPDVAVLEVDWVAPTALVATLKPSLSTPDGSYALSVSNPGGGTATLAGAFEVNASAAPPLVITEVNLSSGLVEVKNLGTVSATLTGWQIHGLEPGTSLQTFTFPAFSLAAGATVVVHEVSGTNTANDLYDPGTTFNWPWANGSRGDVSLVDNGGRNVDFIRVVSSPASTHAAPQGTGGAWMPPQIQSPSSSFTVARSEATALFRTPFGLSWAASTMPASASGRSNNVDAWEDNNQPRRAAVLNQVSNHQGLRISARPSGVDSDWFGFAVNPGDRVVFKTLFAHASGNLDLELYAPGEESVPLLSSTSLADGETLTLTPAQSTSSGGGLYRLRVFGASGAVNTYSLVTANQDSAEIALFQGAALTDGVSAIDFGAVAVGDSGEAVVVTVTNAGGSDLTLSGVSLDGTQQGEFVVEAGGMASTVPTGGSTTFRITFSPQGSGERTAALHLVNSDADESPFDVLLSGTGFAPDIVVEQPEGTGLSDGGQTVDFGSVLTGAISVKRFALKNEGDGPLTLGSVTVDGSGAAEFSCGAFSMNPLPVGQTSCFDVIFSPATAAAKAAMLHIESNDPDEPSFEVTLAGAGTAPSQLLRLVRDVNRVPSGLSPSTPVAIGSQVFFLGTTMNEGTELWRTDGTASGTYLVKDINSGTSSGGLSSLVSLNGVLYFSANTSTNGQELWRSDGTSGGTVLVKDIASGISSASPSSITAIGSTLFFSAFDATNGTELWKSDGTAAGTVLVANIAAGSANSSPANLRNVNGTLFFTANDGINGTELWKSDGTAGGTVMVKDIVTGSSSSSPSNLTALGSLLVFAVNDGTNGTEVWKSDGTSGGTLLLKDIYTGVSSSSPSSFALMGETLYFYALSASEGAELWKTDGTAAGTVLVKDIYAGTSSSSPSNLAVCGGKLYFSAYDSANGREPWTSDGSTAGTVLLRDIASGSLNSSPTLFTEAGGLVYFSAASDGSTDRELWRTDGSTAGTERVRDISPGTSGSAEASLINLGGTLLFGATDGLRGQELWKTDGSSSGTVMILEGQTGSGSANVTNLRVLGSTLYFSASDGINGQELWKTDGSASGTALVKDVAAGSTSSSPAHLTEFLGTLFFAAFDSANGTELWKSDGSSAGTVLVSNLASGSPSSFPSLLTVAGSNLFFSASDGVNGTELWKTDGTSAGTVLVKNINTGTGLGSSPSNLSACNGMLFFSANDGTNGVELWKSDGTSAGTVLVKDIYPGSSSSSPGNFRPVGSLLYFTASTATEGNELWVSDGTSSGTVLVADLVAGATSSSPQNLAAVGSTVYFSANTTAAGRELYKSDGTAAGTVLVKDIWAGSISSNPASLLELNGVLLFGASNSSLGFELHRSDGTSVGTALVKDIHIGTGNSSYLYPVRAGDEIYFSAYSLAEGTEPRKSDGTEAGTGLVADLMPGSSSSSPANLTALGTRLFFTARGPEVGFSELFVLETAPDIEVQQPAGNFLVNASSAVDFGHVTVTAQQTRQFTLSNSGGSALKSLAVSLTGNQAEDFHLVTPPAGVLPAGTTTTFVVQFAPTVERSSSATLRVASSDPDENPFEVFLTGMGVTPLDNWRLQHFGSLTNSGDGADDNDFEADGMSNFLEFCLHCDPTQPSQPDQLVSRIGATVEFTYTRAKEAVTGGVLFAVEWSDSLAAGEWSGAGVSETVLSDDGVVQEVRVTVPAGSNGRRFVRLKVTGE